MLDAIKLHDYEMKIAIQTAHLNNDHHLSLPRITVVPLQTYILKHRLLAGSWGVHCQKITFALTLEMLSDKNYCLPNAMS